VIQTSITAPCRRDQVADILTGAVLRLLATRAMRQPSQVEEPPRPEAPRVVRPDLQADRQPVERG